MNEDLLSGLNDSQRQAVEYNDGPSLVIAGAGSGKTRVLTYKIAYLLQHHMEPWRIMALTFTNKAAREMKDRIGALVGPSVASKLQMGTFHSIFSRILRREAHLLGYNSDFTIYDQSDSRSLVKNIVKEMQLDEKKYKPANVQGRISMAKNHLISPIDYAEDRYALERDLEQQVPEVQNIYKAYNIRLQNANAMDFDDLLVKTYELFRDHPDVCDFYAQRFEYVLVDEYQDTNHVQQQIVWQLTRDRQRVCVVGDDAQSIYGFRGADIDNILDFQQLYPSALLFKLERNYRSTQFIVQAANSLIQHNKRQIKKDVYSENSKGEKLQLQPSYSDKEEAQLVCNNILRIMKSEQGQYSDFAVLYRTNAQSRSFEEIFRKEGVPYRIYEGLSFFQRKEVKDVIAYMRMVANPNDEEAFRRIVNYPARGIGNTTLQRITEAATRSGASLWDTIVDPLGHGLILKGAALNKVQAFRELISSFISRADTEDAFALGSDIVKQSGIYAELMSDTTPEGQARRENIEGLLNAVQDFVEGRKEEDQGQAVYVNDYLQEVSLLSDIDSEEDEDENRVMLMTIHSAKGLEFPTVFIVGMEEGIFPSQMAIDTLRGLEEERRLFYVAITRAERHCILTYAKNRFRYGHMESFKPSRFLTDIDPSLIEARQYGSFGTVWGSGYGSSDAYGARHSWSDNYNSHDSSSQDYGSRYQNSHPVASQFRADPKPKATSSLHTPASADSFSAIRKRQLMESGARLRKMPSQKSSTAATSVAGSSKSSPSGQLAVGNVIEHQRFGIGEVIALEGEGENAKATIRFEHAGPKILLLKFARYNIVK